MSNTESMNDISNIRFSNRSLEKTEALDSLTRMTCTILMHS